MRKRLPRMQPLSIHSSPSVSSSDITSQAWKVSTNPPKLVCERKPICYTRFTPVVPPPKSLLCYLWSYFPIREPPHVPRASRGSSRPSSSAAVTVSRVGVFALIAHLEPWKHQWCLRVSALGPGTKCCFPGTHIVHCV